MFTPLITFARNLDYSSENLHIQFKCHRYESTQLGQLMKVQEGVGGNVDEMFVRT